MFVCFVFVFCFSQTEIEKKCTTEHVPSDFYDGHHKEHNVGWLNLMGHDCCVCGFSGPHPGRMNDLQMWSIWEKENKFSETFGRKKLVADGIFTHARPAGCTVVNYPDPITEEQKIANLLHKVTRVPLENYHSRQKTWWTILAKPYTLDYNDFGIIYFAIIVLTNFLIKEQSPLRNINFD